MMAALYSVVHVLVPRTRSFAAVTRCLPEATASRIAFKGIRADGPVAWLHWCTHALKFTLLTACIAAACWPAASCNTAACLPAAGPAARNSTPVYDLTCKSVDSSSLHATWS
jgi:hypothetical protein